MTRNETAAFANQVRAVTTIKKPDGKTSTLTQKSAQLAPNSLMHQSLTLGDNVAAGDYQVHTVVYWGKADNGKYAVAGAHYQYRTQTSKTVTITAAQARAFSRKAKATKGGMPTIYKILIAIGIVIVVLLLLLLLLLARHRKQRKAQVAALEAQVKALKNNQK